MYITIDTKEHTVSKVDVYDVFTFYKMLNKKDKNRFLEKIGYLNAPNERIKFLFSKLKSDQKSNLLKQLIDINKEECK